MDTTTIQQALEWAFNQGKSAGFKNAKKEDQGIVESLKAENLYLRKVVDAIPPHIWASAMLHSNLLDQNCSIDTEVVAAIRKQPIHN